MAELNRLYQAAIELQKFCQKKNWKFCFTGGLAVQRWGEPRLTVDVDITILTGFGSEEVFVDALLKEFSSRRDDARAFALSARVLLLRNVQDIPLDIALGAIPFEERSILRASRYSVGNQQELITCSAEDLIVYKCFANRDRDWADVEGILRRQHGKLNPKLIYDELIPLVALKQEPSILKKLEKKLAELISS